MALSANTVWEVRSTANDDNGGGYVSGGVDYSQQDSPQWALTGVTTSGSGAVFLTASADANMVGNICKIVSGTNFTPSHYQILSVSAGVSVTVDRSCCTGAGSGGVINIGGAKASLKAAYDATASSSAGNKIWVKNTATYTTNTKIAIRSDNIQCLVSGYGSTRGDQVKATLQRTSGTDAMIEYQGNYATMAFQDLLLDCNDLANYGMTLGGYVGGSVRRCEIKKWAHTGIYGADNHTIEDCYFHHAKSGSSQAVYGSQFVAVGCEFSAWRGKAIYVRYNTQPAAVINCIFHDPVTQSTDDGILFEGNAGALVPVAVGNTFYKVRYGINFDQGMYACGCCIRNNLFYDCSSHGVYAGRVIPIASLPGIRNNAFGQITTAQVHSSLENLDPITLSADPFVSKASGDFSLNNTAGGGAECRAAGFPGAFPGGLTTGYQDIGAVQHQDAGGSGATFFVPVE